MAIEIAHSTQREKPRRWRWQVWLEGPGDELDAIERVVWLLHPTFSEPMREVTERSTGFRLEATGWGEFTVRARLHGRDGSETLLAHYLELGDERSRAPRKQPVVFVSHSAADAPFAKTLLDALARYDVRAIDAGDVAEPGLSWDEGFARTVSGADAVVAIVSEGSPWVSREIEAAQKLGVPVLPLRSESEEAATETLQSLEGLSIIDGTTSVEASAGEVSRSVHDLFTTRRRF